ncbi:MAG: Gldg family protein [Clostridia bacterium]|nr:Gldg family protein [Clostridia bacterium]
MRGYRTSPVLRSLALVMCAVMISAGLCVLEEKGNVVWDLSPNALTRLSEGTEAVLASLEEETCLYLVFRAETDSVQRQMLETLASAYERRGNVVAATIDPVREPARIRAFAQSGRSIAEGSVIVTNADESRFALTDASELFTYQMDSSGGYVLTGFAGEQRITAAIRSVHGGERRQVWFLTGHDEAGMADCTQLCSLLADENYAVGELERIEDRIFQPGDVLLALSPARDLLDAEAEEISRFLQNGGRLLLACDASLDMTGMPRFSQLAQKVSLDFGSGIVIEDERSAGFWMNSPLYLMPALNLQSGALEGMEENQRVLLPGSRSITGPEIPLSGVTYEALLCTSDLAYVCPLDSDSMARDSSMLTGRQQLAVGVSRYDEEAQAEMRMVLMGSLYAAVDNSLLNATYNLDMTMSVIRWLAQRDNEIHVPLQTLQGHALPALTAQESWRVLLATLALPLAAVLTGAVVLIRRRRK